ncbi:hypothetical protein F7734_23265 [Scytonema sp. UIC 10036]|uniref:hypothetical protein n=1 Tax=Scytonema sp. UIC 10036 TaxID=2304196 RepID=UPI0012DAB25E|nr:hypothetical protein [Scytonema sp. UIC 10036]MUG95121.1 hypothetical protein [Scytonema sp. UIC 10036]
MSILTNRLKITFNIEAIKQDFAFIRLTRERKKNWSGAVELDYLIGKEFNAAAVMFQYGKYAYAMFKKPVDLYQLLSGIRANKEFGDNAVIEVPPSVLRRDSEECICEAWLGQILLNSLSSSKSRFAKYHYCNLTGSLLLVQDFEGKNKDYLDVAKITLNSDYLLEVKTVRHRTKMSILSELKKTSDPKRKKELQNALEKPYYIFEAATGSLRRYLPRDGEIDAKLIYIECGLKGKKASTAFLEFSNLDSFYKSRAGILQHVISRINEDLSKYMNVDFSTREIDKAIELNNTLLKKPEQLRLLLDKQLINIVDKVNNKESDDLVTTIKTFLYPNYVTDEKLISCAKRDKEGALNFRIIHDENYYEKMKLEDEYLLSTDTIYRQHLTIESIEAISNATLKTSIKELLIKRDISSRKLNLFDWAKLQLTGIWTFAAWDEDASHVIFMEISPNGDLEFHKIDYQNIFDYQKFQNYRELMTDNCGNKIRTLEGLVISDTNDINQIFCTEEISLPDLTKIEAIISEVDTALPENKRTGNDLAALIQQFIINYYKKDSNELAMFFDELRKFGSSEFNKNSFRKLLNERLKTRSNAAIELRHYLLTQHQIRLNFPKHKESLEDLFDASLNIKYFGETEQEAYYFVGGQRDNIQFSFKDACHLRKIVAVNGSKLIFRQLLPTMDVDFVRTGQSTVIPFPFKYIREYKNFGARTV